MTTHQVTPEPDRARLFVWSRDILYLAAEPGQPAPHCIAHDKLMVALKGRFRVRSGCHWVHTRSCLLPTGQWHTPELVDSSQAVTATWLLPPLSQDYPALASAMIRATNRSHYGHPRESELIRGLLLAANIPTPAIGLIRQQLYNLLVPAGLQQRVFCSIDPRVVAAVRHVQQTAHSNLPLAAFARETGLSGSYLEKLFKANTGLPLTRYRLRYRVYLASILLGMGFSITDAALRTGFSSSSHFSRTYRALTGDTASRMLLKPAAEILLERNVIRRILPLVRGKPDAEGQYQGTHVTHGIPGDRGVAPGA